ncbi:XRE family transcriptional regulator [Mobilicoccus caccae]|uniref:XRE family transcriptional regulator n=1 Tax=Mobilicoccus caccae TaxID=1859295 RepID=A0ABQ6IUV0_9MICO|nr:XRE family transcriptional regulator [Mobilicoccus caccae]GMA40846.1 XRE family transcriptional regulator [Mobilicoccus caccae]
MQTNERLRGAIVSAGLTPADLAERVEVDPKTVERWITTGRAPHRAHRLKAAHILGQDDVYLWPSTANTRQAVSAAQAELVTMYPNRGAVPAEEWFRLAREARESIDLLAFAASFLHDGLPGFAELLADRARAGVRVRLLFGDPASAAVALRGEEEGIGDLLGSRCALSWAYLRALLDTPGIEARQHGATLYNSIFRFDDTVLVNTHAFGAPASHSPVLHIQRIPGGRLHSHYSASFERVWASAMPLTSSPQPPRDGPKAHI